MMHELVRRTAVSAAVMLLLPWLTVTVTPADAGMAVCLLLFFAVNPVYACMNGWSAGKSIRNLWSAPFLPAGLYLTGAWLFFDWGEPTFFLYAVIYLALGLISMGISGFIRKS